MAESGFKLSYSCSGILTLNICNYLNVIILQMKREEYLLRI